MPLLKARPDAHDQVQLHYEDHGTGLPVVLIHGWPLSGRSWEAQVPALVAAGYRVITYDRRGFGGSSQPWDGYDYDTFADDLDAVLSHLELQQVTLVGFSMGGGEVVRYIARHGTSRISAAVLAAAVPPYLYKSEDNPDGGLDDATIEPSRTACGPTGWPSSTSSSPGSSPPATAPTWSASRCASTCSASRPARPRKGTLACIGAFGRTDFRADLAAIDVPTLVIHGDSDGVVPFEVSGKRSAEGIADSTLVVVEGGPHGLNATHPEEFNRALLDFLGR